MKTLFGGPEVDEWQYLRIAKNFLELIDVSSQILKAQWISSRINKNKSTPRYIIVSCRKPQAKRTKFESSQLSSKEWQTEDWLPRSNEGCRMIESTCWKKITSNLEYPSRIEKGKIKVFSDQQQWKSSLPAGQLKQTLRQGRQTSLKS